jgi:putative ABC transport system substrate-binding protein
LVVQPIRNRSWQGNVLKSSGPQEALLALETHFALGQDSTVWRVGKPVEHVIVTNGTQNTAILQLETRTIPIVFVNVADPVASGFVANMASPGGNITGFTSVEYSFAGKWLSIFKDIAPKVRRVMALYYPANSNWAGYVPTIEAAARSVGASVNAIAVNTSDEIVRQIEMFARDPAGGMIVIPSGLMNINRERIAALAIQYRLPASMRTAISRQAEGLCPMGAIFSNFIVVLRPMSIASSAAKSRANCPCKRQPNSSWWSTSRRLRPSALMCRRRSNYSPIR